MNGEFRSEIARATQLRGCYVDRGEGRDGPPPPLQVMNSGHSTYSLSLCSICCTEFVAAVVFLGFFFNDNVYSSLLH